MFQRESLGTSLAEETLREIERALEGRLRAHHISESFIARLEDDSIQKAFAEYLRAVSEGREIENRDGFIVDVAFKRAVDEVRAEVRHSDPATLAAIVDRCGGPAPAAEEEATDHLLAAELHEAVDELSAEKRQALRLYYFEEKTIRECAALLYVSETGFRRVLRSAVETLRRRLGVEIPDPETPLGIEIGLTAWIATAGGLTPMSSGLADHFVVVGGQLRRGLDVVIAKLRELAWRPPPAVGDEGLRNLAASPFGRVAGACVGAVACAVGGAAIWSGDSHQPSSSHPPSARVAPAHRVAEAPTRPPDQPDIHPVRSDRQASPSSATAQGAEESVKRSAERKAAADTEVASAHRARRSSREAEEVEQVRKQTSGIARVESESTNPPPSAEPDESSVPEASEPTTVTPSSSPSPPSGSSTSRSPGESQAEEEFGAFR